VFIFSRECTPPCLLGSISVSNKAKYSEPPIPAGAEPFNNCSIELSKLPLDLFLRANDGRKFQIKCRQRKFPLQTLAGFADADGTYCYPSRERLLNETKFSDGTLDTYLRDLESDELKFAIKGGYAWKDGPRVRRLITPVVEEDENPLAGTQGLTSGTPDSLGRNSVQTEYNPPVLDQVVLDPLEEEGWMVAQSCSKTGQRLKTELRKTWRQWIKDTWAEDEDRKPQQALSMAGFPKVLAAFESSGCSLSEANGGFKTWLDERYLPSFNGSSEIVHPLSHFAEEFEEYVSAAPTNGFCRPYCRSTDSKYECFGSNERADCSDLFNKQNLADAPEVDWTNIWKPSGDTFLPWVRLGLNLATQAVPSCPAPEVASDCCE
jgi:hypothetical protein